MIGIQCASGNTTNAAINPCTAPPRSLPPATAQTGSGAITRSSISRVNPNSWTSGSATAWIPWKMHAIAMTPGTRMLENVDSPWVPPTPWPICGKTYVNTNTNSSGCMTVRRMNSMKFFRSTVRSRSISAPNAIIGVLRNGATVGSRSGGTVVCALIPSGPSR